MQISRKYLVGLVAALSLIGAGVWWAIGKGSGGAGPMKTEAASRKVKPLAVDVQDPLVSLRSGGQVLPENLSEKREALLSMPKARAIASIREFLRDGRDRPTGMEFEIAQGGDLKSWPSVRTFLLDVASRIDPEAAGEIARDILSQPTTADEWALALRNLGRLERSSENDAFLRGKTEDLIRNTEWQAHPSVGYLNAFDVLVHTDATESTPLLSGLVQNKDRKDLAHAAFLTLDRLVQQSPAEMLGKLAADTALQQSRPEMTAQEFARADLRDPAQREIVKTWLLDHTRTATELSSFAGVYPNNNHFVSNNLLTTETQQSGTDLTAHDREVLEIISAWEADPVFEPVRSHLGTMIRRLNGFVGASPPPGK